MRNLFARLWKDDAGAVAMEYYLVVGLLVMGLIAGLASLELSINDELIELGQSIEGFNNGYGILWQTTCKTDKDGTDVFDTSGSASPVSLIGSKINDTDPILINIDSCP